MRLSREYRKIIKENSTSVFGKNTRVYLFGSRVDDRKKGGDIDLFVETDDHKDMLGKKIQYIARLNMLLGEQRIDVLISKDRNRPIEKIARAQGILL